MEPHARGLVNLAGVMLRESLMKGREERQQEGDPFYKLKMRRQCSTHKTEVSLNRHQHKHNIWDQ